MAALAWWAPARWVWLLLPLLPAIGLAPWTGWIVVEETDLAVLSIATGAYLRLALRPPPSGRVALPSAGLMAWALLVLLAVSTGVSMLCGIADAGGLQWGWWQGYREPLNSVRLAKPIAEVLLLLPLWRHACKADPARAHADLRLAMTATLAVVALGVVWERLAFTGLLDFSSDYRSTGLFWEMHVGGAALDTMLALTLPFAVSTLVQARGALRWSIAAAVLSLGLYAALVTFSRIVCLSGRAFGPDGLGNVAGLARARCRPFGAGQRGWRCGGGDGRRGLVVPGRGLSRAVGPARGCGVAAARADAASLAAAGPLEVDDLGRRQRLRTGLAYV